MWWKHGHRAGTLGFVIVDHRYRGQRIGARLPERILQAAGDRVVSLVATSSGFNLYRRYGFREHYSIQQWQGIPADVACDLPEGCRVREVTRADLSSVYSIDAAATGSERHRVLDAVHANGRGILLERDKGKRGFAYSRRAGRGQVIGPVVADSESVAEVLISRLLVDKPGFSRLDIPSSAETLAGRLRRWGLSCVDEVSLMVRGDMPAKRDDMRSYALISQALG